MSIFTAVALTLMSSMQGQRTAIERMRNETLALWIADNQLQSQDSFDEENTSSSGKELINGEEWNWRSDIHQAKTARASGTHHNGDITQRSDNLAYALSKHQ